MKALLHISDPHFGTERPSVVTALENLAKDQSPDLVILSGDITQRARPEEFAKARAFLDGLGTAPRLVIPGNHDIPLFDVFTRIFRPYGRYTPTFGRNLEPVHDTPDLLVIGLRTTRRYRHIEGEVSSRQIERVARRLRNATPGQLRIVVTHHPVHVTHSTDEEHLLRGHEDAIRIWSEAGVDLILGGHIHRPFVTALHEAGHTSSPVWAVQAGTAVSSRIRHDSSNSVNIIRYSAEGHTRQYAVERWDYDEEAQRFAIVNTRVMPDHPHSTQAAGSA